MVVVTVLYISLCVILVLFVLLQQSRSGMGLFGGSSDTILGPSSGDIMTRITSILAVLFVTGALVLSILSSGKKTAFDKSKPTAAEPIKTQAPKRGADMLEQKQEAPGPIDASKFIKSEGSN